MMDIYAQLQLLLRDLEAELVIKQQWATQDMTPKDLVSTEPFAIDKMSFSQWLQFVFLPRMQQMVEAQSPLPDNCSIAPMAEEFFKQQAADKKQSAAMIKYLAAIDQLISKN